MPAANTVTLTIAHLNTEMGKFSPVASSLIFGETVMLHVQITPDPAAAAGTTLFTGKITFSADGAPIGAARVVKNRATLMTATPLPVGQHWIKAQYSGDANWTASESNTVALNVTKAPAVVTVTASSTPDQIEQPVTLTATVSLDTNALPDSTLVGDATCTGAVVFRIIDTASQPPGATVQMLGAATLDADGVATLTTDYMPPYGVSVIAADYAGDAGFAAARGTLERQGATSTGFPNDTGPAYDVKLDVSPATVVEGAELTLNVNVNKIDIGPPPGPMEGHGGMPGGFPGGPPGPMDGPGGMPGGFPGGPSFEPATGQVSFTYDNGVKIRNVDLHGGVETITVTDLPVGEHSIFARYLGGDQYKLYRSAPVLVTVTAKTA